MMMSLTRTIPLLFPVTVSSRMHFGSLLFFILTMRPNQESWILQHALYIFTRRCSRWKINIWGECVMSVEMKYLFYLQLSSLQQDYERVQRHHSKKAVGAEKEKSQVTAQFQDTLDELKKAQLAIQVYNVYSTRKGCHKGSGHYW